MDNGLDLFTMFELAVAAYLIYAAITGRGKIYDNEYLKCPREEYVKVMRILCAVTGVLLLITNVLRITGVVNPNSALNWILWAAGLASIIVMGVYTAKKTDREAAKRGAAPAAKRSADPLHAAFCFDDDEDEKQPENGDAQN